MKKNDNNPSNQQESKQNNLSINKSDGTNKFHNTNNMLEETVYGPVRDAAIIAASQKIEHYEIATYGTLFTFAKVLGENDAAKLLQQTLAAEADKILTDVANSAVNLDASHI